MLSDKSSLKSMKPHFLIFSTALAGIGGRDGEITSGGDGAGAVIASDGDDNNDAREGRDQVVAADALVATEHEGDEKSATPAMPPGATRWLASQSERSHLSLLENKQSRRCSGTIISNVYARCGGLMVDCCL